MSKSSAIDYPARLASFERWFQTPLGRSLLADQRRLLEQVLGDRTGARQLQVGVSHRLPLASCTDYSQKIITTPEWFPHMPDGVVVCDADELPFPGDSMDLVLLHHTADFSLYPHQVLREAARVLRGEGMVALIGFNPMSLWGVRRLVSRHREGPWGGRFLLRGRMEDWLYLLGFCVEETVTGYYRLPVQRGVAASLQAGSDGGDINRFLPMGAYYCILARKRVTARLPRRPAWHQSKVISLSGRGAVGASRGCSRDKSA